MSDDIFISYSRRDQEFVRQLASDLNTKVAGVWFDQSDIQVGQLWRQQIEQGVRDCKAVILVLSPDSAASQYVQMEINLALEKKKTIIPILYRQVNLTGSLKELVRETQYIDLRRGSYADNFQVLVDGLIAAGATRQAQNAAARPFLRKTTSTDWGAVFGRIPGWALAWSLGWAIFGFALWIVIRLVNTSTPFNFFELIVFPTGGLAGGFIGGLLAGLITMLALHRFATSIRWKHMSPGIGIWALSGPLGLALSIGLMLLMFRQSTSSTSGCGSNLGCQIVGGIVTAIATVLVQVLLVLFFVTVIWFLTGIFAGWLAARHIRRLEPGISRSGSVWVMLGWGLGALVGGLGSIMVAALLSQAFGLFH